MALDGQGAIRLLCLSSFSVNQDHCPDISTTHHHSGPWEILLFRVQLYLTVTTEAMVISLPGGWSFCRV